jgi:uncharacterized protein with HEPN domain
MATDGDRLDAILHLIDLIDTSLIGIDAEAFVGNLLLVDATAYRLMHIGENSLRLSHALKSRHPDRPWQLMAAFRNFTAHDYFGTTTQVLWTTARDHLAPLRHLCLVELAGEDKN